MKIDLRRPAVRQFMRYLMVGVMNTVVTLVVIFICKSKLGVNPWVSNAIGYVAGLINSFIWNKLWVFNARGNKHALPEAIKFAVGFLLCYGIQLLTTWFLTVPMDLGEMLQWTIGGMTITGYGLATFIGMGVYTVANFIFNRLVTFRADSK